MQTFVSYILVALIVLPLIGAAKLTVVRSSRPRPVRWVFNLLAMAAGVG